MKEFRQLTVDDAAEYHEVLIAGYAENKNYPISFDAINFSPEESRVWILKYPVFGGSNVVWGSVLGSFILTLLPEVLRFLSDYRDIIYGALLVILMAVRPDGILTESMVDKISRKLGFKKAPYIPESQVLTERFEAYKRKQEEKQG